MTTTTMRTTTTTNTISRDDESVAKATRRLKIGCARVALAPENIHLITEFFKTGITAASQHYLHRNLSVSYFQQHRQKEMFYLPVIQWFLRTRVSYVSNLIKTLSKNLKIISYSKRSPFMRTLSRFLAALQVMCKISCRIVNFTKNNQV